MADIIDGVRARIRLGPTDPASFETRPSAPVTTPSSIAADEQTLGFALPPLLKRLYVEVGNGGWGPGYGLLGLTGGAKDELGHTAIEDYLHRRRKNPADPTWAWQEGLLPICHWGCGIHSCIDCLQPGFPVIAFDPNVHDDGNDWTDALFPECDEFDQWVQLWADGHDLWQRLYADDGVIANLVRGRPGVPE